MSLIALALVAFAQDASQDDAATPPTPLALPSSAETARELELLYGEYSLVAVVGREPIRRADLYYLEQSGEMSREVEGFDQLDDAQKRLSALAYRIDSLLALEGGRNQGYPEEVVDRLVNQSLERRKAFFGGALRFADVMSQRGSSPESIRAETRELLLGQAWRGSRVGREAGPTGRPAVDRYVRPGVLRGQYDARRTSPNAAQRATVGALPAQITLGQIVLLYQDFASREETQLIAERMVEDLRAGEAEFPDLVRRWASPAFRPDDQWQFQPINQQTLARLSLDRCGDGRLYDFAWEGAAGTVSDPLEYVDGERPVAVVVYTVLEREDTRQAISFGDLELQQMLEAELLDDLDELRIRSGLNELATTTFIFPGEALGIYRRNALRQGAAPRPSGTAAPEGEGQGGSDGSQGGS